MKSQIENESEEIGDNFDDIEIKKLNYYRPPDSTITSNNSSISQSTLLYNNERSSQNPISIKSSDLFVGKQDIRNREEERKNIENDNYKNMKEKTISNFNSYINMNKENNGLISNKMSYKNSDKNNIKDMLYQNRNIINNMHNIINSSTNESKTKFESSYINNSSKSLENNSYFPITFSIDKNSSLTKGENEKEKDSDDYKSKGKTFYNYNENYQTKIGGEDNYLENIETFKKDLNGKIIANSNDKNTSYQTNNNNSSTNVSNANSNVYIEKYKFVQNDMNYKDYNQQTAKFNIEGNDKQEEKKEEYKPIIKSSIPTSTTKISSNNNINMNMNIMSNKLINTKDYFFNYRTQEAFDKMNQAMTQPVQEGKIYTSLNNNNITSNNNINKINITNINSTSSTTTKIGTNYNEINIKNDSSKYNNFLNSNDLKIKKEFKQYNAIEPNNIGDKENKIKLQIENEEKKLRKLEGEKSQLIKEEKETKQIFYNELTKRDNININNNNTNINMNMNMNSNTNIENSKRLNIIKSYQEKTNNQLKDLLIQTKNDDDKIKPMANNPNITNSATNLISNINMNMNGNTNTNSMNMNLTQNYNSYNINSNINTISKEKSSPNLSQKYPVPNYSTNSIDSEKNDNYYREFLKQIQDRNEQINKKTFDTINNNLNKNNQNFNYEKINKNEINVQKKKSLSVGHKQIEIKEYMNNYTLNYNNYDSKKYLNNNTYSNASTINVKNEYNLNTDNTNNSVNKKTRYESEKKYNINSYFQLKDKENDLKNKKTIFNYDINYDNKNKYEQTLSSYNDENNKENNKANNTTNNTRIYPLSYTPKGLYRSNKTENNLLNNTYLPKNTIDNNNYNNRLIYNDNNNNKQNYLNNSKNIRDEIIKTLTTNNYNSMTQTRFYRNKDLPETTLSNYSNENLNTITNLNTIRDYNNKIYESYNGFKKQNSTRSFSNLNFDINKDLISNATKYVNTNINTNTNANSYMSNRQNSTIVNNTLTTLSNNTETTQTNNYYNINNTITSNINNNNSIDNKLNNTNKCKCTLRKGKSCSNIDKYIDSDSFNESNLVDFYSKNYKYNYNNTNGKLMPNYNKGYGASTYNRRNTYRNATLNNFNKINNNSFKYNNNNANICDKCFQKYFSNRNFYNMENNGSSGSTGFANNNNMRICETCKKLGAAENGIKRVNYFPFA